MNDVLAYLDSDEPSYDQAADDLGADALPYLRQLAEADDIGLAGKAAYLAGRIGSPDSAEILQTAARHADASVRVAAAAAISLVPPFAADPVLRMLVTDEDSGVRRIAVESALEQDEPAFLDTLREVADHDQDDYIRGLASDAIQRIDSMRPLT
jgi:HEAT repeat protein